MNETKKEEGTTQATPRWRQRVVSGVVFLFVCWHLTFLVVSNTKMSAQWISGTFRKYETYAGIDQAWGMFNSPLWRSLPFPAVRIHLADGASDVFHAPNEPADFTRFFRIGSTRQRKIEHYLITRELTGSYEYQAPMQRRLAEWYAGQWQARHEHDGRKPVRVTLLRLDYQIPKPGEGWSATPEAAEREVASFTLETP